jgi:hypothetical protein
MPYSSTINVLGCVLGPSTFGPVRVQKRGSMNMRRAVRCESQAW